VCFYVLTAFINLDRMYRIDERQRCIQSACNLDSFITGSCSVPTASATTDAVTL